jgi:hypothetical protein
MRCEYMVASQGSCALPRIDKRRRGAVGIAVGAISCRAQEEISALQFCSSSQPLLFEGSGMVLVLIGVLLVGPLATPLLLELRFSFITSFRRARGGNDELLLSDPFKQSVSSSSGFSEDDCGLLQACPIVSRSDTSALYSFFVLSIQDSFSLCVFLPAV